MLPSLYRGVGGLYNSGGTEDGLPIKEAMERSFDRVFAIGTPAGLPHEMSVLR